ncbi:DUF4082 domain-containing protein [Geomesophilobacter sediminis]|uniref:DUF4082 domain-containing protein n=1 Tax=Geomesophilobacter sediminis TaxID=2798584 RepID=A0A8J7M2S0_9BACT|nr:DUF4082 domain-containing protein [Geomesophilobacter sediminis]MBJ6727573.1 DUF4082 domain-containing protein [Geomesophilobacter sediminis]
MHIERKRRSWRSWLSGLLAAVAVVSTVSLAGQCLAATSATFSWSASAGATGYKLYYQPDSSTQPFKGTGAAQGASPITLGNVTSTTLSGLDPAHNYYAAVTAFNSAGESAYSNVVLIPESVAPTVSITAPANGATATGTMSVTANATDNIGVTKVEFYVNGTLAATDTATPYLYSWNTSNLAAGTYTLTAKAYDAAGNVGTSSAVSVSVVKDTTAPTVSLSAPASGATLTGTTTLSATASDNIGVTKVEFYANGALLGATNVAPYSYSWNTSTVANGSYTLTAKAYDAAGNVGTSNSISVTTSNSTVTTPPPTTGSTYTIWPSSAVPKQADSGADSSVELGVKFKADTNGTISGIRFYKASTNTGTHTGTLWSATGTKLATATFSGETASGWQQVNFSTPVAVTAGTVYVASYHCPAGHYAGDLNYFASAGYDNAPLHALANGVSGYNGCFSYGSTPAFPNQGYNSCNYWVDVVFSSGSTTTTPPPATLTSLAVSPANQSVTAGATVQYTATGTYSDGSTKNLTTSATWSSSNTAVATVSTAGVGAGVSAGTATVTANVSGITGSTSLTVTSSTPTATNVSLFSGVTPATGDSGPDSSVELGMKFKSDVNGYITGIRFYKASTNTGTHTGTLWSASGTKLATGTFSGETASGWQQLNFSTPVAISAGTVYVASYHAPAGHYSDDLNYFSGKTRDVAPLHALADGTSGYNGVYNYGSSTIFPSLGFNASNYYVDVVFHQ